MRRHRDLQALVIAAGFFALSVLLFYLVVPANAAGPSGISVPALEVMDANTTAASGNSGVLDAGENGSCAAVAELVSLDGGTTPTTTYTLQTSSNATDWYTVTAFSSCSAPCTKTEFTKRTYMRYLRLTWANTGDPNGVSNFYVNCFR